MYNPISLKFHLGDHHGVSVIEMKDGFIDEISDLDYMIVLYKVKYARIARVHSASPSK